MRPEIKIYIAAKVEHAAKLAAYKKDGFHFNARWIHMAALGAESMKPVTHWQQENFDDIEAAHFVIFYVEPGDKLKGALVEIGYAIRAGKQIWIAGDGHGVEVPIPGYPVEAPGQEPVPASMRVPHRDVLPWGHYAQNIHIAIGLDVALSQIKAFAFPSKTLNHEGQ